MKRLLVACLSLLGASAMGCSLGQGEGQVFSPHLHAHECWGIEEEPTSRPAYDLQPDFFAAITYRDTLQIRIQRGNDIEEVSDGLQVLIDDVPTVRDRMGRAEVVSMPAGVRHGNVPPPPPTTPLLDEPSLVHSALYLHRSCHNQNIVLYGISGTVTFSDLFSGDPNEKTGSEKYTEATFDIEMGDLDDLPFGEPVESLPEDKRSRVSGYFRFYFERGQPGQPFP